MHHNAPEGRLFDALLTLEVFFKPSEFLLPIGGETIQLSIHIGVIGLVFTRIEDNEVYRPMIPGIVLFPLMYRYVLEELACIRTSEFMISPSEGEVFFVSECGTRRRVPSLANRP